MATARHVSGGSTTHSLLRARAFTLAIVAYALLHRAVFVIW
jgi:hypothetical protein